MQIVINYLLTSQYSAELFVTIAKPCCLLEIQEPLIMESLIPDITLMEKIMNLVLFYFCCFKKGKVTYKIHNEHLMIYAKYCPSILFYLLG